MPEKRPGVTINRRDLIAVPVPAANLLWRDLHTQKGAAGGGTRKILIEVRVEGVDGGKAWARELEFYYANEESFYCRAKLGEGGKRMEVPAAASRLRPAYLPPMSGLAATETRLDEGAINVRLGEGRTAEVLRNLCWQVLESRDGEAKWLALVERMRQLFGVRLDEPKYLKERGEVVMSFRTPGGVRLDLSSSGRGQQQTLLLLAHMASNPGSVLLLDEPDAHLEILSQRQLARSSIRCGWPTKATTTSRSGRQGDRRFPRPVVPQVLPEAQPSQPDAQDRLPHPRSLRSRSRAR